MVPRILTPISVLVFHTVSLFLVTVTVHGQGSLTVVVSPILKVDEWLNSGARLCVVPEVNDPSLFSTTVMVITFLGSSIFFNISSVIPKASIQGVRLLWLSITNFPSNFPILVGWSLLMPEV